MGGDDRTKDNLAGLDGLERLGLLAGTARAGDWSRLAAVTGLSVDSRKVQPGHVFAALPGARAHGAEFVPFAIRMGAAAILTDAEGAAQAAAAGPLTLPVIVSPDPRRALAVAAARWSGTQPATMVAVTGTNGKTSVASFVRQIWEALGLRAVNIGTTGVDGAISLPLAHTTPEPLTLHAILKEVAGAGVTHAAMEASSHGLDQRRLDGVRLKAAGFTNLTRDHLDYHPDLDSYFVAKAGLFTRVLGKGGTAVINLDDPRGAGLAAMARAAGHAVLGTGAADAADLRLAGRRFDATGQEVRLVWRGAPHQVRLGLIGGFQADNVAVAAGLAIATGSAPGDVMRALPGLRTVRGRMELAATRANGAQVFVDYAHTPDALETALKAMRPHVAGRIVVVFGAGGDRDRGKRPLMGAAAHAHADVVYVTDDNPRGEDPAAIRAAILAAAPGATEIGDRAEAILTAVDALLPGDALLVAGKGHESGQVVGTDVFPFDDAEQASISVRALEGAGS
jgi:UDP-N-acetylmuramoyl-L-alanyl-D-glutamate--2,6-diaminopimelate ligase